MISKNKPSPKHVLIVSSHSLFGHGIRSLLVERKQADVIIVGVVSTLSEAMKDLNTSELDLVIVDYDDQSLNREEIFASFAEGKSQIRVVMLSLTDAENVQVYDHRMMRASQIEDWLKIWSD